MGVCVVENLSRVFSLKMTSFTFEGNEGIYIVWVKGKKVTLKNLPGKMFRDYLAGRP